MPLIFPEKTIIQKTSSGGGGSEPVLITKTITSNGTYEASNEDADGYSEVTVNVPTGLLQPKDNVIRDIESDYHCLIPKGLNSHLTQSGGTLSSNLIYTGGNGAYLVFDETFPLATADSWEFQTKYTYKGGGNQGAGIIAFSGGSGNDHKAPVLIADTSGRLVILLSSNGSTWGLADVTTSNFTFGNNTTYYLKFGFDGSKYYFEYNTDGSENYTEVWSKTSTDKVYCSVPLVMMNSSYSPSSQYSSGDMDLLKTKFIINGVEYLRCATPEQIIF